MRDRIAPSPCRQPAILAVIALCLFFIQAALPAQQETSPLLPHIPLKMPSSAGTVESIPGEMGPDPDEPKELYGYIGPYYNVTDLKGRVAVLEPSLYRWPTATWKVSGMLRNETRAPVQITRIVARLLGSHGELLATASASTPVDVLRPGEPGPFVIEASLSGVDVRSVDWQVDSMPAPAPARMFELSVYSEQASPEFGYYVLGRIRNANPAAASVQVVAAWLDSEGHGRVLFVDSPRIQSGSDRTDLQERVPLDPGRFENFIYRNQDPRLIPLLGEAQLVLWGISR